MVLEQQRDMVLTRKIITLQKVIRAWHYRRKFYKMKTCCIVLQSVWRGFSQHRKYQQVHYGHHMIYICFRQTGIMGLIDVSVFVYSDVSRISQATGFGEISSSDT